MRTEKTRPAAKKSERNAMRLGGSIGMRVIGVVLLLAAAGSRAQVTMSVIDPNSGSPGNSFCEYAGISATLNGSTLISSGADWIGIYSFNVQSGSVPNVPSPFYSVCLSPLGNLGDGNITYNVQTFAQAIPGLNPAIWNMTGIQNANYLFSTFSGSIVAGDGVSADHLV